MKNKLNVIVLAVEIAAVVLLHAVKLNFSDKHNESSISSHSSPHKDTPAIPSSFVVYKLN